MENEAFRRKFKVTLPPYHSASGYGRDSGLHRARSITRTIRVDEDIDRRLAEIADEADLSVNFLINKALRKLVEWDVYAEKFGNVSIPESLVSKMVDYMTEDETRELGGWMGRNVLKEFLGFWFKQVNLETFVEGFSKTWAKYTRTVECELYENSGRTVMVIEHSRGPKCSAYYEEMMKAFFRDVLHQDVRLDRSDDQVVVSFAFRAFDDRAPERRRAAVRRPELTTVTAK